MQKIIEERTAEIRGHGFFDFERSAYGTLELELEGVYAEHVEVVIGEMAENDMIVHHPGWTTFIQERLKLSNGRNLYQFNIPPHLPAYDGFPHPPLPAACPSEIAPFRYAEINHYYGKATVRRRVYFDDFDDDAAFFESSDGNLNKVWEFCKYSIKATNVFGVYIDGERERQPYEGDAYINQLGHFCCDANYNTARQTIDFFEKHPTWPTEWQLLTPILARDYLLYSGDRTSVERWLKWLPSRLLPQLAGSDGLLRGNGKIRDIVDWPQQDRDGYVLKECNFVPNAYRYGAALALHELTGDEKYLALGAAIKRELRRQMWQNKLPEDSPGANHTALHTALFALRFGIAEKEEIPALTEFIASRGMMCSVYVAQYLLEVCAEYGLEEHFYKLLTASGPRSWLDMLAQGSTISMESWGEWDKPFQDWTHAWGAAPANLIPRHLCGVRPVKPGFALFTAGPLKNAPREFILRAPTPKGAVTLEFSGSSGKLTVPEGTQALYKDKILNNGSHFLKR